MAMGRNCNRRIGQARVNARDRNIESLSCKPLSEACNDPLLVDIALDCLCYDHEDQVEVIVQELQTKLKAVDIAEKKVCAGIRLLRVSVKSI